MEVEAPVELGESIVATGALWEFPSFVGRRCGTLWPMPVLRGSLPSYVPVELRRAEPDEAGVLWFVLPKVDDRKMVGMVIAREEPGAIPVVVLDRGSRVVWQCGQEVVQ